MLPTQNAKMKMFPNTLGFKKKKKNQWLRQGMAPVK